MTTLDPDYQTPYFKRLAFICHSSMFLVVFGCLLAWLVYFYYHMPKDSNLRFLTYSQFLYSESTIAFVETPFLSFPFSFFTLWLIKRADEREEDGSTSPPRYMVKPQIMGGPWDVSEADNEKGSES